MRILRLLAVGVVAASALVVASPSTAVPPVREPVSDFQFTAPAGAVCSFPLSVETVANNQFVTIFFDHEGSITRIGFNGLVVVRVTNDDTGKSLTLNISGPGTLTFNEDGSLAAFGRGITLFLFGPSDNPPSQALLTRGHVEFTVEPNGTLTLGEVHGDVTDICAALA